MEKSSLLEGLRREISNLKLHIENLNEERMSDVTKLQDALLKKDDYISTIKEEQYRQEREIAQLEEIVFEKKQTRLKVSCAVHYCMH